MSIQYRTLDEFTDKQKSLLTQLAYIDYDSDKLKKISSNGSITISDLSQVLKDENSPYLGKIAEKVTGIQTTQADLIQELKDFGLGNIRIKKISRDTQSGFFAIAFEDEKGNIGMSFRGTDVSNISELIKDSLTDATEYITDNDKQVQQAKKFYIENQNENGANYLYGHSLGGNLVEHIYSENYQNIKNAFIINPNHINESLLNTEEKKEAFNNSDRYNCFVIGGDWVSELKECNIFKNNIKYVKNNNQLKHNILSDHAVEAAMYNEKGNFLINDRQSAYSGHKHKIQRRITKLMAKIGKTLKRIYKNTLGIKQEEIKALPIGKSKSDFSESMRLENFETADKLYKVPNIDEIVIHKKTVTNTRNKSQEVR